MSDPAESLWTAIHENLPLIIVFYPDYGLLEKTTAEVDSLADPSWTIARAQTVEEALQASPESLVMLIPDNEVETIKTLEGCREHLVDRQVPIVLFLLRNGSGSKTLQHSASLMSWVRGNTIDPEALALIGDLDEERAAFERDTGATPEKWLERSRAGKLPTSTETLMRTYRALLLERR